jgi:hypothetical protein
MSILDIFDQNLRILQKKELIYLYIMLVGGIFFLSYYFLFEQSKQNLNIEIKKQRKISKQFRKLKDYISFHDDYEISKLQNTIDTLKSDIELYKDKTNFLQEKLNLLSKDSFNKTSWTTFLKLISQYSRENGVEIEAIQNQFLNIKKKLHLQKAFEIKLVIKSDYKNTLIFINKLESNNFLVTIDFINILFQNDEVKTALTLFIWSY